MPVKWTNRSRPPSSGVMKPNPLSSLNHLTVPIPTDEPRLLPRRRRRLAALDLDRSSAGPDGENVSGFALRAQDFLSRELGGGRGDLVAVAGTGHPGEPQRVVRVARDDVHVEVEDGLPGGRSARVEQVHAVRPEALLDARGQLLRHPHAGLEVLAR